MGIDEHFTFEGQLADMKISAPCGKYSVGEIAHHEIGTHSYLSECIGYEAGAKDGYCRYYFVTLRHNRKAR